MRLVLSLHYYILPRVVTPSNTVSHIHTSNPGSHFYPWLQQEKLNTTILIFSIICEGYINNNNNNNNNNIIIYNIVI